MKLDQQGHVGASTEEVDTCLDENSKTKNNLLIFTTVNSAISDAAVNERHRSRVKDCLLLCV